MPQLYCGITKAYSQELLMINTLQAVSMTNDPGFGRYQDYGSVLLPTAYVTLIKDNLYFPVKSTSKVQLRNGVVCK